MSNPDASPPEIPTARQYRVVFLRSRIGPWVGILLCWVIVLLTWPSALGRMLGALVLLMVVVVSVRPMIALSRRYDKELLQQVHREAFPRSRR